jgi:uncharacterized protein YggE
VRVAADCDRLSHAEEYQLARHATSVLAVVTTLLSLCSGAYAQQSQLAPEVGIVVTGEGSVNVPPNYAQIGSA